MGQQQLLLLVLGIVIVGLAVVIGIQAFEQGQRSFRQDQTHQLAIEIAAKAQVWKLTPAIQGGGANGADSDFAAFTLAAVGLQSTGDQGAAELIRRNEYTCLRVAPAADALVIQTLDVDCTDGSWWSQVTVTGTGVADIEITANEANVPGNGL